MTKEELKYFIQLNIPIAVKAKKQLRYNSPFTSNYAREIVIDVLAEKLSEELNKTEPPQELNEEECDILCYTCKCTKGIKGNDNYCNMCDHYF